MIKRLVNMIIVAGCFATTAHATLNLQLTHGINKPIPIAILGFQGADKLSETDTSLKQIIHQDLKYSGHFQLVKQSLLKQIKQQPLDQFHKWSQLHVNALVIGSVNPDSQGYRVNIKLVNVLSSGQKQANNHHNYQIISQHHFQLNDSSQLRHVAHQIANQVYQQLVGKQGYFTQRLAYVAVRLPGIKQQAHKSHYMIQTADYDGHHRHTLVQSSAPLLSPSWSPKGHRLAYIAMTDQGGSKIKIRNLKKHYTRTVSVGDSALKSSLAWSPHGDRLAFSEVDKDHNSQIKIWDIAKESEHTVTQGNSDHYSPRWLDSQHLLYVSNAKGSPQSYKLNLSNNSQPHKMTSSAQQNTLPQPSVEKHWIGVLHGHQGAYNIQWINLNNHKVQSLTDNGRINSFALAPHHRVMIYAATDQTGQPAMYVQPMGQHSALSWSMPFGYRFIQPAWRPQQTSQKGGGHDE